MMDKLQLVLIRSIFEH